MAQVHLSPYCSSWLQDFAQIRLQLLSAMAPQVVLVEHIGSTAVPGLCAKPVIDVMLGAPKLAAFEAAVPAMAAAGFDIVRKYEAALPERRYFVRPATETPRVHVHAVCTGSLFWRQQLAFRDALRADEQLRQRYGALKQELALLYAHDKARYTDAKAPFVQQVLASADAADLPARGL